MKDSEFEIASISLSIKDVQISYEFNSIHDSISLMYNIKGNIDAKESFPIIHDVTSQIFFMTNSDSFPIFKFISCRVSSDILGFAVDDAKMGQWLRLELNSPSPLLIYEVKGELLTPKNADLYSCRTIIFFKNWEEEFRSLSELREFLAGYMLIS